MESEFVPIVQAELDHSRWRFWTKVVAWFDIFMLVLYCILLLTVLAMRTGITTTDPMSYERKNRSVMFAVISIVFIAVQMQAAFQLLDSTNTGQESKRTLGQAVCWRNVTLFFAILSIVASIITRSILTFVVTVLWRGIAVYIVCKFMREIESGHGIDV